MNSFNNGNMTYTYRMNSSPSINIFFFVWNSTEIDGHLLHLWDFSLYTTSYIDFQWKHLANYKTYTASKKSLTTCHCVCHKTTLNTGGVGGTRADHQTWKLRTSFLMSLAFVYQFWNISNQMELPEKISTKIVPFYYNKIISKFRYVSRLRSVGFHWKFTRPSIQ